MKKLLAAVTTLVDAAARPAGIAAADRASPDTSPADGTTQRGTPGRGYALGGAHVLGIPYDEYIRRTGAEWFPGLDRQIVDYPAGQVQGHVLERMFPGIGRLDDRLPRPGYRRSRASASRSTKGRATSIAAIRDGGPGTAIGLSEGALVLNAVQARLANDPNAPPPDQLSFATYRRSDCAACLRRELPDPELPGGQRRSRARLPDAGTGGESVRHSHVRLRLRQHRRLAGPAGQHHGGRATRSWVWRPVTPPWHSPTRAWCRRRTSGRPSTPRARRRRRI